MRILMIALATMAFVFQLYGNGQILAQTNTPSPTVTMTMTPSPTVTQPNQAPNTGYGGMR